MFNDDWLNGPLGSVFIALLISYVGWIFWTIVFYVFELELEMTQTIEQLTARVRELEGENARLKEIEQTNDTLLDQLGDKNAALLDEVASQKHCYAEAVAHYEKQLAAAQTEINRLRDALSKCSEQLTWLGYSANHADQALAIPHDTSALDAYVAKRLHDMACDKGLLRIQVEELTRQRDLAVEALKAIAGRRVFIEDLASNVDITVMTLDSIKESKAK